MEEGADTAAAEAARAALAKAYADLRGKADTQRLGELTADFVLSIRRTTTLQPATKHSKKNWISATP